LKRREDNKEKVRGMRGNGRDRGNGEKDGGEGERKEDEEDIITHVKSIFSMSSLVQKIITP
jgi:hypothetical protein